MITREVVDGRNATVSWLTEDWQPSTPKEAQLVKIIFDDGDILFLTK